MEQIGEILKIYKPRPLQKRGRQYWIYQFLPRINDGRYDQDKYDYKRMGRTLKRWQLWELPVIWKECETSKNFGAHFWWAWHLKPSYKKPKPPKQLTIKMGGI